MQGSDGNPVEHVSKANLEPSAGESELGRQSDKDRNQVEGTYEPDQEAQEDSVD